MLISSSLSLPDLIICVIYSLYNAYKCLGQAGLRNLGGPLSKLEKGAHYANILQLGRYDQLLYIKEFCLKS